MALHVFKFDSHPDLEFTNEVGIATLSYQIRAAKLRPLDEDGNYSGSGKFSNGYIITRELLASGIKRFIGINIIAEIPDSTSILFQVSVDGGTTWQYFNGFNWVNITASNEKNTCGEVGDALKELKFKMGDKKRIKFKIFLNTNSDADKTPVISHILLYSELRYNLYEDVLVSLKRFLQENYSANINYAEIVDSSSNSFSFSTGYKVKDVDAAYNVSKDPHKAFNILTSFSLGDPTLIDTSVIIENNEQLWIDYKGIPKNIYITAPDALFEISSVPSIVISPQKAEPHERWRTDIDFYEIDSEKNVYIKKRHPVINNIEIAIDFVSLNSRESFEMVDAVFEILDINSFFKSVASGYDYIILLYKPLMINNNIKKEIISNRVILLLSGTKVFERSIEVQPISKIVCSLDDFSGQFIKKIIE